MEHFLSSAKTKGERDTLYISVCLAGHNTGEEKKKKATPPFSFFSRAPFSFFPPLCFPFSLSPFFFRRFSGLQCGARGGAEEWEGYDEASGGRGITNASSPALCFSAAVPSLPCSSLFLFFSS